MCVVVYEGVGHEPYSKIERYGESEGIECVLRRLLSENSSMPEKQHSQRADKTEDGAGSAHASGGRAVEREYIPAYAPEYVQRREPTLAVPRLDHRSRRTQRQAIYQQMRYTRVKKYRRNQSVQLSRTDQCVLLHEHGSQKVIRQKLEAVHTHGQEEQRIRKGKISEPWR